MSESITITCARDAATIDAVRSIFCAYKAWLEGEFSGSSAAECLSQQSFESEIATLPAKYLPPEGDIVVAYHANVPVGAIAFYRFNDTIAELKRFYVMPEASGKGIGGALFDATLHIVKERGYSHIRLDTLKGMSHARALYARYNFKEIAPYNNGHLLTDALLYLELDLSTI